MDWAFERNDTEAQSAVEPRYFCLGVVEGHVMTDRFTFKGKHVRILGAGYWRKG